MAQIWECTNREYHGDTTKIGSTMLCRALKSPADYYDYYMAPEPKAEGPSEGKIKGGVLHALVLDPPSFDREFAVEPECDGRTTKGKELKAKFALECVGKTPVKAGWYAEAQAMAEAIKREKDMMALIEPAIKERAIVWQEDGLDYKCRPDLFIPRPDQSHDLILDLKSDEDPTPANYLRSGSGNPIRKWRYDMRLAHYFTGVLALTGRPCSLGLIVVGSKPPHDVYCYGFSAWLSVGMWWRNRAVSLVRQCLERKVWRHPDQDRIVELAPNDWDIQETM